MANRHVVRARCCGCGRPAAVRLFVGPVCGGCRRVVLEQQKVLWELLPRIRAAVTPAREV